MLASTELLNKKRNNELRVYKVVDHLVATSGFVETDMNKQIATDYMDAMLQQISLGRIAKPEEIAKVAVFLASDDSSYITGQIIRVDGGM